MGNGHPKRYRDAFSSCRVCGYWSGSGVELAVDADGMSPREVDGLCTLHRARATEGACVLCGRRWPWLMLKSGGRVGVCRPCFVGQEGEEAAQEKEVYWAQLERNAEL
jgi:hypothetical protein